MAGEPDVRVRLSAEGVSEVIAAFRKIQAEAVATSKKLATKSPIAQFGDQLQSFAGGLGGVKTLLGTLGFAVSIAQATAFARSAAELADQLSEATEKLGGLQPKMAGLFLTLKQGNIDLTGAERSFQSLGKTIDDFVNGKVTPGTRALSELGIKANEFQGKDLAESFVIVGKAIAPLEAGWRKDAIAADIFGRSALRLIPALNQVGKEGVDKLIDRMSLLFAPDVTKRAGDFSDLLTQVGFEMQGLGVNFVAGFAESVTPSIKTVEDRFTALTKAAQAAGVVIGQVFKLLAAPITTVAAIVAGFLAQLTVGVPGMIDALTLALKGHFTEARRVAGTTIVELGKIDVQVAKDVAKAWKDAFTIPSQPPGLIGPPAPRAGPPGATPDFKEEFNALKAAGDAKLALLKLQDSLEEEQAKASFEKGLSSLRAYYDERRKIITDETSLELLSIANLRKQAELNPDKKAGAVTIKALDDQRDQVKARSVVALTQANAKELEERQQLIDRVLQIEKQGIVDEETVFQQRITEITHQGAALETLLLQLGHTAENAAQQREKFTTEETTTALFDHEAKHAEAVLGQLAAQRDEITANVNAGLVSQLQGENQILAAERARIPELEQISAELNHLARDSANPELARRAADFATQLKDVDRAIKAASFSMAQFKAAAIDAGRAGLVTFLTTSTDQFHDLGSAALAAADQVLEALRRMAAEALATEIFNFIGLGGHAAGGVVKKAAGGLVHGPGTETSDSVPALLSRGEFVVRASSVRKPGILPLLQQINSNVGQAVGRIVRKASGGLIGGHGSEDGDSELVRARAEFTTRRLAARSPVVKKAAGGTVFGAGTETSDSVPAMLSRGEFVVRASAVRQPGVLPLLNQINFGQLNFTAEDIASANRGMHARIDHRDFTESLRTHFAEGGLASPLDGRMFDNGPGSSSERSPSMMSPAVHGKLQIGLSEGLVIDHMKSPAGHRAWLEVLTKNRRTVQGIVQPGGR
jgi:hypothetical protein